MEWACPPGTLPDKPVQGSRQTLRQLGTVVHDCNPGYPEAEAGIQGMQVYRVRPCLKTKQSQPSFSRLTTLPLNTPGLTEEASLQ